MLQESPVEEHPTAPAEAPASESTSAVPTRGDVAAVHTAYERLRGGWNAEGGLPYKRRMALLKALKKALKAQKTQLAEAIRTDYGCRSEFESIVGEVFLVMAGVDHARNHLRDWMEPRDVEVPPHLRPARARIVRQPLGVVGIIAPWNYPLQLCLAPLTAAIAAGNRVLIKTSEFTPATHQAVTSLLSEVFPDDIVQVVHGEGDVGAAVASLPLNHILFTGSTRVGRMVMAAAAEHLTPVTLELGGKSPALIHESFPMAKAAERIVWGKMFNSGQTCIAPDYVMVPEGRTQEFVDAAKAAYARMYPSMKENTDHTAIISDRHFARLQGLVSAAKESGVTVAPAGSEAPDPGSRKMPLTMLMEPGDDLAVMQEEIFGPLLPVVTYSDLDSAIRTINARPRPLALYYFDRKGRRVDEVLARTTSGGVSVNECLAHITVEDLPFGGVGPSGLGAYHGETGFLTFTHQKSVLQQARFNLMSLLNPPYGGLARWFAKIMTSI